LAPLLLVSVFVIATCGLVYELVAGTLASYLLGDSVTQFSTVIGAYLSAMGIGSWLSRYVRRNLVGVFAQVEILVGALGGGSAALLFLLFERVEMFRIVLYADVLAVGILVGIEIPLLLRILKDRFEFSDLVSRVFTFDYAGALFASILFPLLLVPHLGLIQTGFLFGMLNVMVAVWLLFTWPDIPGARPQRGLALAVLLALLAGFIHAEDITGTAEAATYPGKVIHAQSTPYQRIVLTRSGQDLRLYLNGNLQFSSLDEYRYHEALVHPLMASLAQPKRVLIIGGGDGLALREILKYTSVQQVVMVDLDPAMTKLFASNPLLTALNHDALASPKLHIVNRDAFVWLRDAAAAGEPAFDAVLIDLPDPSNYSIGKLYSLTFYRALHDLLKAESRIVVQSTSPLVARKTYWCVADTLAAAGYQVTPYHTYVPSFGEWGFLLAGQRPWRAPGHYPTGLRFVNAEETANMLHFPADMAYVEGGVQRLDNQLLVRHFDEEWSAYQNAW